MADNPYTPLPDEAPPYSPITIRPSTTPCREQVRAIVRHERQLERDQQRKLCCMIATGATILFMFTSLIFGELKDFKESTPYERVEGLMLMVMFAFSFPGFIAGVIEQWEDSMAEDPAAVEPAGRPGRRASEVDNGGRGG
ncbi:hypothetical protein KVT40_009029 [Elsinoe batatas]|uniref:Uncharacterized protein n=1 Tax=Elsinoe batatas TaxID=2601811 RepID=A0A8K0L1E6_9PEZI|nr:hypothetical protein KVT40_009029 [Elsinoe batatas]